ncbi:MAG TPA: hypothetical protein VKK31_09370 [Thermoanaerobaculia bacterium]|nr:hypothetical protein [Thermoanaerobaculia bacterium]
MKASGCAALGCAGVLVVVLAGVTWLSQVDVSSLPDPAPSSTETDETDESDAYRPVEALNQFRRDEAGDRLRLSYGFIDHHGRRHQVSCILKRRDYDHDLASFGYFEAEMDRTLNERLRARIEQEGRARGVLTYFEIEVYGRTGYRWRWETPAGLDPALRSRVEAFDKWLDQDLPREKDEMIAAYLRERGLRLQKDLISVDYEQAALGATEPLEDCYQALRKAGNGDSERRLLGLFLAFFQELRYEVPPDVDHGRHTLGFWPPSEVMARGAGDCDSKSAAFCAMWRHLPRRAILILVPEHALVGVEAKPRVDEAYVRLGNRYFVLCEVAGPAKIPPGGKAISGSFEYVMIEPVLNSER